MTDNERYDAMRDEIIELKNTIDRLQDKIEAQQKTIDSLFYRFW